MMRWSDLTEEETQKVRPEVYSRISNGNRCELFIRTKNQRIWTVLAKAFPTYKAEEDWVVRCAKLPSVELIRVPDVFQRGGGTPITPKEGLGVLYQQSAKFTGLIKPIASQRLAFWSVVGLAITATTAALWGPQLLSSAAAAGKTGAEVLAKMTPSETKQLLVSAVQTSTAFTPQEKRSVLQELATASPKEAQTLIREVVGGGLQGTIPPVEVKFDWKPVAIIGGLGVVALLILRR